MKIITKALSRSDLYDIIFKLDTITLDLTLINEFSQDKGEAIPLIDLQAELEKLPLQLRIQSETDYQESEIYFTRAYHLFLLLTTLKNKKQIRLAVPEFLAMMLNSQIKCSNYYSKPYSVIYSFYGENAVSAIIESISRLPGLTVKEKEFLVPHLENAYYFSLSVVNIFKVQNTLALGELAFSLFCEQNSIKSDFLQVKYEKRGNNKFVSPTANNVLNLLAGSKFSKMVPKNTITTWVDLVAQVKAVVLESLNSILEEVNTEENESLKDLNIKDDSYNAKNVLFFNTQSINLVTSVNALIQNSFERIKEVKEIDQGLSAAIESLSTSFVQKRGGLFALLMASPNEKGIGFGADFGAMVVAKDFLNVLYQTIVIEALNAYKSLDALNQSAIQKAPKGKPEEETKEANPKADKKVAKKIQLGKGTVQVFSRFEDEFFSKLTNAVDAGIITQFAEYFNPFNIELQAFIEDIVSPKNNERRKPKIPKGTRDMDPKQMTIRRMAINTISNIFRKHGAVEIDTPVFELRETLTGKYGEASKLIYDLSDQGGEQLSLRYDLTVPFARYLAQNGLTGIKRLHIAKVYRRDQPQPGKGRYREFYQCDYDIVGSYGVMIPDAECIMILNEIFTTLALGKVIIKINHRKLLDAMVELSGAPKQKFKTICSSIDKLDKEEWKDVREELIREKGLTEAMADKLGQFVKYTGSPAELYERLCREEVFKGSKEGEAALKEMGVLVKYLTEVNCTENVLFDLSLARGLDYYTGLIYEAVLSDNSIGLGSIAGGGRYDELVGMFGNKDIPAVGLSIGIERIFVLLEKKLQSGLPIRERETEVIVGSIGSNMAAERFKLCKLLWENEIKAEILYNENPKPQKQLEYALENYVPFILWIGEDEIKNNQVKIKCLYKAEETQVSRDDLIPKLKESLAIYSAELAEGKIEFKRVEEKDDKEKGEKEKGGKEKGKRAEKAKEQK